MPRDVIVVGAAAGLGNLRNVGKWASVLGDWTDRFPDYRFRSIQERLNLFEGRPRQM